MDTVNHGQLSKQLKTISERIFALEDECGAIRRDTSLDVGGLRSFPAMFNALELRASRAARETWNIDALIPEIGRLERIERALESIGVNLDEEDIAALEVMASNTEYSFERGNFRDEVNALIGDIQDSEREAEQEQALESLAKAGFVLNDDDGETWTKDNVTVKIESIDGSKCQYRWEYESGPEDDFPGLNDFRPIRSASGLSGEFHRLLALIGQSVSSDSSEGSVTPTKVHPGICPNCGGRVIGIGANDPEACAEYACDTCDYHGNLNDRPTSTDERFTRVVK